MKIIEAICSHEKVKPWDQLTLNLIEVSSPKLSNIIRNLNPKVLLYSSNVISKCFYERPFPFNSFPSHTSGDVISMIDPKFFCSLDEFKQVLIHELCHWSEARCGLLLNDSLSELISDISTYWLCDKLKIYYRFQNREDMNWEQVFETNSIEQITEFSELIVNFLLRNA